MKEKMNPGLEPTYYINSDNPEIIQFALSVTVGAETEIEKAVQLFYTVRDQILYNPYSMTLNKKSYAASSILSKGEGICTQKAILLAALSRAVDVQCRLRFAIVRNHLATKRLKDIMKTDLFVFHGYNEFLIEDKWVKATPTFNLSLCEKFGVHPLEFDGKSDSVFNPFDREGKKHMEYVHDYGSFYDFPFEVMLEETRKHYPHMYKILTKNVNLKNNDFEQEAADKS